MAISMSNTGGAWDNCKKYIESNVDPSLGAYIHLYSHEYHAHIVQLHHTATYTAYIKTCSVTETIL
jgi:Na+/H+-translocating membrane pyrophosphatase